MNTTETLIFLKLRNLIASKEFEIASANQDLAVSGRWLSDYHGVIAAIDNDIAATVKEYEDYRALGDALDRIFDT